MNNSKLCTKISIVTCAFYVYIYMFLYFYSSTQMYIIFVILYYFTSGNRIWIFTRDDLNIGRCPVVNPNADGQGSTPPSTRFFHRRRTLGILCSLRRSLPAEGCSALPRCCGRISGGRGQTRPCSVLAVDFKIAMRRPS